MRKTRRIVKVGIAAPVVVGLGIWGGVSVADSKAAPTPRPVPDLPAPAAPPWVNPDGSMDTGKIPDQIGVVGPDGRPVLDKRGNEVQIDSDLIFGPPDVENGSEILPDESFVRRIVKDSNGAVVEIVEDDDSGRAYSQECRRPPRNNC